MNLKIIPKSIRKRIGALLSNAILNKKDGQALILDALSRIKFENRATIADDAGRFLARCLYDLSESHAQLYQDLWVLHELKNKRDGFFVEFGATDGLDLSNTYLLERKYGWTGILAEPNPVWHKSLHENRNCKISGKCVYSRSGEELSFLAAPSPAMAGIASAIRAKKRKKWEKDSAVIKVETVSLNDLVEEHNAPTEIDFMSVDTEGSELEILSAFDFGRWNVKLMCVEHNHADANRKIEDLLSANGYERKFRELSNFDGWFVKR